MRYSAVYFGRDGPIQFWGRFCYREGNEMILAARNGSWDIISTDDETGIFLTEHWMGIPETHPYYNYGLLVRKTADYIKISTKELIFDAAKKLRVTIKAKSKPI